MIFSSPVFAIPPPPVPDAPPGAATYSSEQLETTPPQELVRLLFSDWARGLVEKRTERGGVAFYTKPKAEHVGVCSITRVDFWMAAPTSGHSAGRAYVGGMTIEQLYHLVDIPLPFDPTRVAGYKATRPLCDALPAGTKYFPAPSAAVVAYQHHLIEDAVAQARGGNKLSFKLDCIRGAGRDCNARKILSELHPSEIRSITKRDCPGYSRDECYEIEVGEWVLETESRLSTYGYSLVEPDRILVGIGLSKFPHYVVVDCPDCD